MTSGHYPKLAPFDYVEANACKVTAIRILLCNDQEFMIEQIPEEGVNEE
ncbi:hypothetical protein BH09VER1_BH09VER1_54990 [soil metagenome]